VFQNILSSFLLYEDIKIKINRTVILPVVLYGNRSLSRSNGISSVARVFENRMGRKIF
jgi:hypothetical protein